MELMYITTDDCHAMLWPLCFQTAFHCCAVSCTVASCGTAAMEFSLRAEDTCISSSNEQCFLALAMSLHQLVQMVDFFVTRPEAYYERRLMNECTIEYSDRTEYTAYAERLRDNTELGHGLTKEAIENMCFNEFAETVQHKWINAKPSELTAIDQTRKRKFRTRDVNSGHWRFTRCKRRKHTRWSTVLHTTPAIDYEFVEHGKTTTQTTFFDLPINKQHQLYRSYYELVMYVPRKNTCLLYTSPSPRD